MAIFRLQQKLAYLGQGLDAAMLCLESLLELGEQGEKVIDALVDKNVVGNYLVVFYHAVQGDPVQMLSKLQTGAWKSDVSSLVER